MGTSESKQCPPGTASSSPSEDSELAAWEKIARRKQQLYLLSQPHHFRERLPSICVYLKQQCKTCSRYDSCYTNNAEMNGLKKLIGLLMFGEPKEMALKENSFTGFNKDQMKKILIVFTELLKGISDDGIEIAIIWISLLQGGKNKEHVDIPVFRVPGLNKDTPDNFVDLLGRRYNNWDDFVCNNKLPPSKCYMPLGGKYSVNEKGEVEIVLDSTPAAKLPMQILRVADTVGTCIGAGAGLALLYPPAFIAGAVISGVVSVYGIVRSSVSLADRGNHNQSIKDREAFRQWVSLVGNVLGLGSTGALVACRVLVAEGKLVSEAVPFVVDGLRCFTGVVNGIGAMDHALDVLRRGRPQDPLQSFQMAAHLMLLMACAGSDALVIGVIKLAQEQVLPLIVNKVKGIFQKMRQFVDLNDLLRIMEHVCGQFPYGLELMRAVRIIIDCYNCRSVNEAARIMTVFTDLLHCLCTVRIVNNPHNAVEDKEIIMGDIVKNDNFIPQLLHFLESGEKNFHFPSDHCHWDDDGELSPEEYTLIGQNAFDIPQGTQSHVWMDSAGTATVYFEQFGLVTIVSDVNQQIITLKNIKKTFQSILNS